MKSILKSAMFASVAAMGLSLAACDSAAENKMEDDANATREAADEAERLSEAGMGDTADVAAD